jgi:hypothetical protein
MQQTQQARAPQTQPFGEESFGPSDGTTLRWLGMAGFLINSRGTTIMIDPLLEGFDMPIMIDMPIAATDVPELDAILVTHSDNDHYSVPTCRALAQRGWPTPTRRRRYCSTTGGVSTPPTSPRSTATQPRYPAWSRILSASSSSPQANPMNTTASCRSVGARLPLTCPRPPITSRCPDIDSTADLSARRHRPSATVEHWTRS